MVRFLRASKLLALGALICAGCALAAPEAASADSWRRDHHRGGFWLPLPPPPPFFFPRIVHRHGPYCGHGYYGRYDRDERYERPRYDRDERHERRERHADRHERW